MYPKDKKKSQAALRAAAVAERKAAELARAARAQFLQDAAKDFEAIKLTRQREADDAKRHIVDTLCHPAELRPLSEWVPLELSKPQIFFKVVAATKDGRLVSVFDGTTKYELNKWTLAKHGAASWPPVYGCYYAFNTPEEAIAARFPEHSTMRKAPRVLIKVESKGRAYRQPDSGAWALSQVKPLDILTQISDTLPLDVHYALNPVAIAPEDPLPNGTYPELAGTVTSPAAAAASQRLSMGGASRRATSPRSRAMPGGGASGAAAGVAMRSSLRASGAGAGTGPGGASTLSMGTMSMRGTFSTTASRAVSPSPPPHGPIQPFPEERQPLLVPDLSPSRTVSPHATPRKDGAGSPDRAMLRTGGAGAAAVGYRQHHVHRYGDSAATGGSTGGAAAWAGATGRTTGGSYVSVGGSSVNAGGQAGQQQAEPWSPPVQPDRLVSRTGKQVQLTEAPVSPPSPPKPPFNPAACSSPPRERPAQHQQAYQPHHESLSLYRQPMVSISAMPRPGAQVSQLQQQQPAWAQASTSQGYSGASLLGAGAGGAAGGMPHVAVPTQVPLAAGSRRPGAGPSGSGAGAQVARWRAEPGALAVDTSADLDQLYRDAAGYVENALSGLGLDDFTGPSSKLAVRRPGPPL